MKNLSDGKSIDSSMANIVADELEINTAELLFNV